MVKIRLARIGKTKAPFYRLVVADERVARNGKIIEQLGTYDPLKPEVKLDAELAKKWIANGAQPTETAKSLLKKAGVIEK